MKKNLVSTLLVTSFLLASAIIAVSGRPTEGEVPAPPAIGSTIDDFSFLMQTARSISLAFAQRQEWRGADLHGRAMPGVQCIQRAHGKAGPGLQSTWH